MATRRDLLPLLVGLLIPGCSWFTYSSDYHPQPKPGSALRLTTRNNRVTRRRRSTGESGGEAHRGSEAGCAARTSRRRSLVAAIESVAGGACLGVSAAVYLDGLRTEGSEYDAPLPLSLTGWM